MVMEFGMGGKGASESSGVLRYVKLFWSQNQCFHVRVT